MSNDGWDLANRAVKRLEAKLPVMFRRQSYRTEANFATEPLWHRLERITRGDDDTPSRGRFKWVAVCGYRKEFNAILGAKPQMKDEIKTKSRRCKKCDAAVAKAEK